MILKIVREPNEKYVSYVKRVVYAVRDGVINYSDMGDCLLGDKNTYSSENLRKGYYLLNKIVDYLEDDVDITEDDVLDAISREKNELFKEVVRLRDQQRQIRKDLYTLARYENLERVLIENLESLPQRHYTKEIDYDFISDKEASLLISDSHYGIIIDNEVNAFDTTVCEVRLEQCFQKAIKYCKLHKIEKLNVDILGDLISGTINLSARVDQEEDVITQIIQIANILAKLINFANQYIPVVEVHCVFGNHARTMVNKRDSVNRENYERLVYKYLELSVNSSIVVQDAGTSDYLYYTVEQSGDIKRIVCTHGDKDNVSSIVQNCIALFGWKPDEIHLGHFHTSKYIDDNNTSIYINGSICGTDEYAVSIRKNTYPAQWLIIHGEDDCAYKLELY